ncbi:hypothetical protein ACSAZL_15750 [Methanosarcina sp. T3]|uniref:hypothetical protein n=1 Tax=Methanosarcina sp. T3 TaxID=3439062 RepID=UPI003F8488F3
MDKNKSWIVTTGDDRPIHEVAKDLVDAGLKDVQVLQDVGIITGSAEDDTVAKLRKVRGVKDVSADLSINIGPPDSRETW